MDSAARGAVVIRVWTLVAALWLGGCGDRQGQQSAANVPPVDAAVDAPTQDDEQVRIATFNTRLFFDSTCDTGACGVDDFERAPSERAFLARARELATAVQRLHSDIVLLQEVESQRCLDALLAELAQQDVTYPIALLGETGAPASVDVAVLARGSLLEVIRHRDQPLPLPDGSTTRFARELLEVRLELRGSTFDVFAAHFRSKNNDDPARRLAEAIAAQSIVAEAARTRPRELVVLGGDLNDVPGSDTILQMEKDGELLRVASDRPVLDQATYIFQSQPQAIDHLFAAGSGKSAYVPGSALVLRDSTRGYGGSDHAVLRAAFRTH